MNNKMTMVTKEELVRQMAAISITDTLLVVV